jgi:hypothetical protein
MKKKVKCTNYKFFILRTSYFCNLYIQWNTLKKYFLVVQFGKAPIDGVIAAGNKGRFIRAEV